MEASALTHPGAAGLRGPTPLLRLQSDERLITLIRRGNHAAFEALVGRYQSRLLAFCRHMLNSREDAEDVLQEVFAAAFNAILADDRPINVRPWLYRIARNRSLNHLRRHQAIGVDSMDVHLSEGGLTTADKVHRREEFRALIGDVQELPETQRTALLLREIDALSYDQIAETMETTVPSVKSLLVRARVALAEMAEARQLTCEEVREELGEVAEGLKRTTPPVRRHLRNCDRCTAFRKQLRDTNKALASVMPVAPLLLFKKLFLAQLGTTASAGGSAAAAGGAAAGGAVSAGVGTVASKAAAGLAAAAIVSVGAVEVKRAQLPEKRRPAAAAIAPAPPAFAPPAVSADEPAVVGGIRQPTIAVKPNAATAVDAEPKTTDVMAPQLATADAAAHDQQVDDAAAQAATPAGGDTGAELGPTQQGADTTVLPPQQPGEPGTGGAAAPPEPQPQPQPQPEPQPQAEPEPQPEPKPQPEAQPQPEPEPEPQPAQDQQQPPAEEDPAPAPAPAPVDEPTAP